MLNTKTLCAGILCVCGVCSAAIWASASQVDDHGLPKDLQALAPKTPLKVRRTDTITLAQAYAHHEKDDAHGPGERHVCLGVTLAYRAIQFAAPRLFANSTPEAADLELSVAGPMPGIWDTFRLYLGRELKPVRARVAPEAFTFTATRPSTGRVLRFKVKSSLIPEAFFALKAAMRKSPKTVRPKLEALKLEVIKRILSTPPEKSFELLK